MNNFITNDYLLQFRLRTARHKTRMQHRDFEKQLRKLSNEKSELYTKRRNIAWVELETSIMRGWKRYYVLREDIIRGRNKTFFENLLQKINTIDYSSRKDFKKKKRKFGKKIYVVKLQQLLMPERQYIIKQKFTEKELSYFEEKEFVEKWRSKLVTRYVFTEPWRFVLRIRPNIITKVQIKDVELEQRISEIENYIQQNNLRGKMHRLIYGHYNWRYDEEEKVKEINPLRNKSLTQILDRCKQANE